MTPVTLERARGVRQYDGTAAAGWAATCSACGRCRLTADDGRSPARSAGHAVAELARTCPEPGVRHYYRSKLAPGLALSWSWRGERRPAHLVNGGVCGGSGEVSRAAAVYVTATAPEGADARAVARLNRKADAVAFGLRRRGWERVILERATQQEAVGT